ncbi:MAG: peptidase T [Clostridiales bacterium]|nr:peptidase T [Clostridiales bacterium]
MKAYERLINYAKVHTASAEMTDDSPTPTTGRQFDLARLLEKEMKEIGVSDVYVDEHCYVYGRIPASPGYEDRERIGFLAHLDTVPDFSGENVKPRVIEDYDGGDIVLGESGRVLSPADFPHLEGLAGETLVVTDGTTVLGGDDKAGIAEIMTAAETVISSGLPHGQISIGFCPDEEVGHGASLLDLDRFGAEVAYTVDGGDGGDIEYECFNAASAEVRIKGFNVHPGGGKDMIINAAQVAFEFNSMIPSGETPRHSSGKEGYYHMSDVSGTVESAKMNYILRDFEISGLDYRKQVMTHAAKILNEKYGAGTVTVNIRDQYRNMLDVIKPRIEVVEKAYEAIRKAGLTPTSSPIRGGTDGAQLSFRGLPCPNLPTGAFCGHGPYEHVCAEHMDKCAEIIVNIVKEFAE